MRCQDNGYWDSFSGCCDKMPSENSAGKERVIWITVLRVTAHHGGEDEPEGAEMAVPLCLQPGSRGRGLLVFTHFPFLLSLQSWIQPVAAVHILGWVFLPQLNFSGDAHREYSDVSPTCL